MNDADYNVYGVPLPPSTGNATLRGQIMWQGKPVIDDDDGGTAGVREPRRPRPSPLAPASMSREFALV